MANQFKIEQTDHEDTLDYPDASREYKDRLFRFVFRRKEDLLSLYNAVAGTNYDDPDALEVNTLDNVFYLSMKNDLSFLISGTLNLYEHQSTYNPNMPLRGLMYFAGLYEKYIAASNINIYSSAPKTLPFPQHFVFYNGTDRQPDRKVLYLSDLFEKHGNGVPALECRTVMLNINYGHNKDLLEKCHRLGEYAVFVARVRDNLARDLPLKHAVMEAIDSCIAEGILQDILIRQKAEVVQMVLETYDKELYEKDIRNEGYDKGYADGKNDGCQMKLRELIEKKLSKGKTTAEIAEDLEEDLAVIEPIIASLTHK